MNPFVSDFYTCSYLIYIYFEEYSIIYCYLNLL